MFDKKGQTKEEAKIEQEAVEAANAAVTALVNQGTANGPEMTFKLFRSNTDTSAPTYEKNNWCGPIWRKDCVWGYILLILTLVYVGFGGYFVLEVNIYMC